MVFFTSGTTVKLTPSYTTLLFYLRSPSNVQALLVELKLERWGSIFEGVDGATLSQLQDDDLKENRFLPTVLDVLAV